LHGTFLKDPFTVDTVTIHQVDAVSVR